MEICGSIYIHTRGILFAVAPMIDVPPSNATIATTEGVMLTCTVSGFPLPTTEWLVNGSAVLENETDLVISSENISLYEVTTNISLSSATISNSGVYTCLASNGASNDSRDAVVLVQGTYGQFLIAVYNL